MKSLRRILFREPDGRRIAIFFSLLSLALLLGWAYFGIVLDGPHNMLFLGIAFAFYGIAESLPPERRRSAGALRILGIGTIVVFLALLLAAPELIWAR